MRFPNIRFSTRTLLLSIVVLAMILALGVRFGPHVAWVIWRPEMASSVMTIPSQPLVVTTTSDPLVNCTLGPISFNLPERLTNQITAHKGLGGPFLSFQDGDAAMFVVFPSEAIWPVSDEFKDDREKSQLTLPRLLKEMADANSGDFSFKMSRQELAWHQWLISHRLAKPNSTFERLEYSWRSDLDGTLSIGSAVTLFQWATVDGKWQGTTYFKGTTARDIDWIRHVCATFSIDGDPGALRNLDNATIMSTLEFRGSAKILRPE